MKDPTLIKKITNHTSSKWMERTTKIMEKYEIKTDLDKSKNMIKDLTIKNQKTECTRWMEEESQTKTKLRDLIKAKK